MNKKPLRIEEFLGPLSASYCLLNDENRAWIVRPFLSIHMMFNRNLLMIFADIRKELNYMGKSEMLMMRKKLDEREERKRSQRINDYITINLLIHK